MKRILLYLVHMKGSRIPGFYLKYLGRRDQGKKIVEQTEASCSLIKSPLLLRMKHNYSEYKNKMEMKTNSMLGGTYRNLFNQNKKRSILTAELSRIKERENALKSMDSTGNVLREKEKIQRQKDSAEIRLTEIDSEIEKLEREVAELVKYKEYCKEKTLQKAISKSYSYIEGCQLVAQANGFYPVLVDHSEDLFLLVQRSEAVY